MAIFLALISYGLSKFLGGHPSRIIKKIEWVCYKLVCYERVYYERGLL